MTAPPATYTAFVGVERLVRGTLEETLRTTKKRLDAEPELSVLIFEDATGKQVDFNLHGSLEQVMARARPAPPERAGPGRPKLGVVSREVSLLPRHWEWLERHPQGISAALRRLVEEASKRAPDEDKAREARAAASRFMWVMGGDLPRFEEASRALFAGNKLGFAELTRFWPAHVREHLDDLLREGGAFDARERKASKK